MRALVNGVDTYYIDVGEPQTIPIVLIHGVALSHEMWRPQIEVLNAKFRGITYDLRGHGQSGVGDGQYAFEFFIDDLISLLDYLRIERAVLCGLSMGGLIALRATERNPERILGLILADTQARADSNEAKLKRAADVRSIKTNGLKPFAADFLKILFSPPNLAAKSEPVVAIQRVIETNSAIGVCGALIALATRTDITSSLSAIQVPTLILVGEQDNLTPVSLSQEMHDGIVGSQFHILKGAAHLSNFEKPNEFNQHLTSFLKKVMD
jgi:3-oxoadipate enol-lactonase